MCNMSDIIRSSLKKKNWCKGPKIDEKVTSLNVEDLMQKLLLIKSFFLNALCARLAHQNLSRKKSIKKKIYQIIIYNKLQIKYTARKLSHQ